MKGVPARIGWPIARVRATWRTGAPVALWGLRLSGPVVLAAILVTLLYPQPRPARVAPGPEPAVTMTTAPDRDAPVLQATPGVCADPAISGCDAYSACVAAVTIFGGLASDPRQAIADGLAACAAGAD